MTVDEIVEHLTNMRDPLGVEGMTRFGINPESALGIRIPVLRKLAKKIGKDHKLALQLWETGIHEVRILATMVDNPEKVTLKQMDAWVKDFNSWDLCDQACNNLFVYTVHSYKRAFDWIKKKEEFVKRAGFTLAAVMAVHKKEYDDEKFTAFFPYIKSEATDERNFVKKAVNWALRQIGKRNRQLNILALELAHEIERLDSKSAKWIAKDAIRELSGDKVRASLTH